MTDRELEVLVTDLESDRVERKASADRDKIREHRALAGAIAAKIGLPLAAAQ